jgi:hypothetical protein
MVQKCELMMNFIKAQLTAKLRNLKIMITEILHNNKNQDKLSSRCIIQIKIRCRRELTELRPDYLKTLNVELSLCVVTQRTSQINFSQAFNHAKNKCMAEQPLKILFTRRININPNKYLKNLD